MARKLAAIAFTIGCMHAGSVFALGLGEMQLQSFLNEPLKASVDLLNMGGLHDEQIRIQLAGKEDFDKLGIERNFFLTSLAFTVVADGKGGARILISSEEPVLEPYLDFVVEARWPSGRLIREYTVLVDPQVFSQATPVVSASQRVEEEEGIAAPAKKSTEVAASGAVQDQEDPALGNWGVEGGATSGASAYGESSRASRGTQGYSAGTASRAAAGSRYTISRDQTLWQIASQAKPAGVSVHQAMLDIQRLNPDAFINGNINRIKEGYVIYLPTAEDISSGDTAEAIAAVREQNSAFREGRTVAAAAAPRPKLTISAEPEEAAESNKDSGKGVAQDKSPPLTTESAAPTDAAAPTATNQEAGADGDTEARLAALEQQLQSLQRIVTLKDDQIAALQAELKDAGAAPGGQPVSGEESPESAESVEDAVVAETPTAPQVAGNESDAGATAGAPDGVQEVAAAKKPKPKKTRTEKAPPFESDAETAAEGGWVSYVLYLLGALVLAVGAFVLVRRRSGEAESSPAGRQSATKDDVFSAVRLQEQRLVTEPEVAAETKPETAQRNNRGYGERKHDQYASDVDSADALAEADIYIAYGRHQQAIDLLNNALANEPGNPVYLLKLIEIFVERNNGTGAAAQMEKLQANGDPDSIARGAALMKNLRMDEQPGVSAKTVKESQSSNGRGLPPNPLAMMSDDTEESLEANFSGLQIEKPGFSADDDLDLSADFGASNSERFEDEELVIAADSNGLSTKLDLARAYLDMGDDDGARQILAEVVAEGSEELKAEARALLDRIGG